MATIASLRSRRSIAQLQALAGVESEIDAQDSRGRCKYLREFSEAFRSYEHVLIPQQVQDSVQTADIVLIGDYHALPAAQRYAGSLLEQRALVGDRPVVLGVESIFARDQHILDEWWRREIDEAELRRRIRFDTDWGYDWVPFYELLTAAREHGEAIYGLDCMPRGDFRRASLHDRHAAARISEIGRRHPNAVIMVLFGESHLAPGHLPYLLRQNCRDKKLLTILQNVDALYWRAAGESCNQVQGVRISDDVICVFNATPLEKYEHYRLCLDRWCETEPDTPDFSPAVYNLVHSLTRFLNINCYSPRNGTQPRFLIDSLPEVSSPSEDGVVRKALGAGDEVVIEALIRRLEERGSVYVARANTLFVREFHVPFVAEEIARFLHHGCRGLPEKYQGEDTDRDPTDRLYAKVIEHALAGLAAQILCPVGTVPAQVATEGEAQPAGRDLGAALYDAYVQGKVSRTFLRRLFLVRLEEPGAARKAYLAACRKAGLPTSSRLTAH